MSDPSDGGRALVPAVLSQDAGAPPHPSRAAGADVIGGTATAIAKAESLQERESHGGPQQEAQGEAQAEAPEDGPPRRCPRGPRIQDGPQEAAQGDGEVRVLRYTVWGHQLRIIGQSELQGPQSATTSSSDSPESEEAYPWELDKNEWVV